MNIKGLLAILALGASTAFSAQSATQLELSGTGGGNSMGPQLSADGGSVVTFDVLQDITDATISLDLALCLNVCEGKVSLFSRAPDLTTTDNIYIASIVRTVRFCATARPFCDAPATPTSGFSVPFISGVDLLAGTTYSLVVSIIQGGAIWFGTNDAASRTVTGTGAATHLNAYTIPVLTDSNTTLHNVLALADPAAFNYKIEGTVSVVPLPASGLLLGAVLLAAGVRRRN